MRLAKKIIYNATATVVNLLSGLLRNKIVALFLPLTLFGILSIGQQSSSLLSTVFAFGLPLGITTVAAQLLTKSEQERNIDISRLVVLAITIGFLCFLTIVAAVLGDPQLVSRAVTTKDSYGLPISLVLFAAPFMVVETCLFAILEGTGRLRGIVIFRTIPGLTALPVFFVLTSRYGLTGAAASVAANELLLAITGILLLKDSLTFTPEILHLLKIFRAVFKVAILSFLVGVSWFIVDFLIKRYVLQTLGEMENGIIQSVAKITDLYPNIALSWLSMHLFPSIATHAQDKRAVADEVERTSLAAIAVIVPIILLLFAFRPLILELVYKREFTVAVDYFGAMLTNGVPKVFSWVLGLALLPMGLKKEWFWSTMIYTFLYAGIAVWGLHMGWSIYSLPAAGGFALCAQTAYVLVVYNRNEIVFGKAFVFETVNVMAILALLVLAVFFPLALTIVLAPYAYLIVRSGIATDIRNLINEFRTKSPS